MSDFKPITFTHSSDEIKQEVLDENDEPEIKCLICEEYFDQYSLEVHYLTCHSEEDASENTVPDKDTKPLENFNRDFIKLEDNCSNVITDTSHMENIARNEKYLLEQNDEEIEKCHICSRNFDLYEDFVKHMKEFHETKQSNLLECNFCKYKCKLSSALLYHVQSVHRKFMCCHCNEIFQLASELSSHKQKEHLQKNSIKCNLCQRNFKTPKSFEIHMKHVHEGLDKNKCQICSKSFTLTECLKLHMKNDHKEIDFNDKRLLMTPKVILKNVLQNLNTRNIINKKHLCILGICMHFTKFVKLAPDRMRSCEICS